MTLRAKIAAEFERVGAEHDKVVGPLTDDLPLIESGLDSLCFAIIVARLEEALGVDPFSEPAEIEFPVTFGDFVRLYDCAGQ
jgi:acyl carrier protein